MERNIEKKKDELLRKLIEGVISDQEMHQLEKWSLDDPFLAEAMEGLVVAENKSVRQTYSTLKKEISLKKQPGSGRPVLWILPAAAAILIVVMALLWMFPLPENKDQEKETTTLWTEDDTDVASEHEEVVFMDLKKEIDKNKSTETEPETEPETGAQILPKTPTEMPIQFEKSAKDGYEKRITDEGIEMQNDEMLPEKQEPGKGAREFEEAVNPPEAMDAMNDGPVRAQYKSKGTRDSKQEKPPTLIIQRIDPGILAEPEIGLDKYEQFINEHMRIPNDFDSENSEQQSVDVLFTLDSTGTPGDFIILTPLCDPCELEAIRLLKEGGKWKTVPARKQVKIKCKILFNP